MIADPNIAAKITFSSNNAQIKKNGTPFIAKYKWQGCNSQVIQNGIAIDPNLYIALINQGDMQRRHQLNNIKLSNKKGLL